MKTTEDKVWHVIKLVLSRYGNSDGLNRTMSFEEAGGDSLDAVEIVMELEDQFNIHITDKDIEQATNIGRFVNLVCEKAREKSSDQVASPESPGAWPNVERYFKEHGQLWFITHPDGHRKVCIIKHLPSWEAFGLYEYCDRDLNPITETYYGEN